MKAFGTGPNVMFSGYFVCCSPEGGMGHPENPDHGGVAVWLSPCCDADWDPSLDAQITIDAEFSWATINDATPHDMCTEKQCSGRLCNAWTAGSLLLPERVQMPPYYGQFGTIENPEALVLTNKTLASCPGPTPASCEVQQDTDYVGGDYASRYVGSTQECCDACAADAACVGAVLFSNICYMK